MIASRLVEKIRTGKLNVTFSHRNDIYDVTIVANGRTYLIKKGKYATVIFLMVNE